MGDGGPSSLRPLVGRDAEADLIGAFVDRAAFDSGALHVEGEAGVGKTAILDFAAARAAAAGDDGAACNRGGVRG